MSRLTAATDKVGADAKRTGAATAELRKGMTDADHAGKTSLDLDPPQTVSAAAKRPIPKFESVQMHSKYVGEHTPAGWTGWIGVQVRYLDRAERAELALTVRDGKLHNTYGEPYNTGTGMRRGAIWVMDEHGNLYASTYQEAGRFHHSSLVAGDPVAGAGTMMVRDGRIIWITDHSGHYLPKQRHSMQVIEYLRSLGLRIGDQRIDLKAVD